jgi:imidazolonepropionase-like amidohydrolase
VGRVCFIHANLLDGEHPAKPDSSIVVRDDRIASVTTGPVVAEPGDRVIDCGGRTVMPGMVSGHYHTTFRNVGLSLMPPLGLEHPPAYQACEAAYNLGSAIRAGVTSVVGAGSASDVDAPLRDAINDGLVLGPRVVPGSRLLITTADSDDATPWWWEARALGGVRTCDGPDEFRRGVREEARRGAEVIKLTPTGGHGNRLSAETMSLSKAELDAAVEAAHGLGIRTRAHVAGKAGIMRCLEAGVDILDHGDGVDEECLQAMAETGTFYLPTISSYAWAVETALASPDDPKIQALKEVTDIIGKVCEILPTAMEAGVRVCLGDDYGVAHLPHGDYGKEPGQFVKYGSIPPLEVLRWATVNGGALVGRDDLGRIQEGFLADIIVVSGDPSQDIEILSKVDNIHAVMRDGQILVDTLG